MKNNLLIASVVSLAIASASFAHAEITISGEQTYMLTFYSGGKEVNATTTGNSDEHTVQRNLLQIPSNSEIVVKGGRVTEDGLTFGGEIQFRATTDAQVDEAFVYVGSDAFGMLVMGADDDALDRLAIHGGTVLAGLEGEWKGTAHSIGGNDDDAKIVYLSPSWGGFRGGVSFTPTKGTDALFTGRGDGGGSSKAGTGENAIAAAGQYQGEFWGIDYKVGGGARFETAYNRDRTLKVKSTLVKDNESVGDVWGYQLGMMTGYKRYSFSMGYGAMSTNRKEKVFGENAFETDFQDSFLSFGARYDYRKGGISVGYNIQNRTKKADASVNTSGTATLLDLDYQLGEGILVLVSASMNASDADSLSEENDDNNRSETIFGVGFKALF